jgi:hypothetical protein
MSLCIYPGHTNTIARQGTLVDKESVLLNRQDAILSCLQATADRPHHTSIQGPGRCAPLGLISDDRNPQTGASKCEALPTGGTPFAAAVKPQRLRDPHSLVIEALGSCLPVSISDAPGEHIRGIALFSRPSSVQRYGHCDYSTPFSFDLHLLAPRASVLSPLRPAFTLSATVWASFTRLSLVCRSFNPQAGGFNLTQVRLGG